MGAVRIDPLVILYNIYVSCKLKKNLRVGYCIKRQVTLSAKILFVCLFFVVNRRIKT